GVPTAPEGSFVTTRVTFFSLLSSQSPWNLPSRLSSVFSFLQENILNVNTAAANKLSNFIQVYYFRIQLVMRRISWLFNALRSVQPGRLRNKPYCPHKSFLSSRRYRA